MSAATQRLVELVADLSTLLTQQPQELWRERLDLDSWWILMNLGSLSCHLSWNAWTCWVFSVVPNVHRFCSLLHHSLKVCGLDRRYAQQNPDDVPCQCGLHEVIMLNDAESHPLLVQCIDFIGSHRVIKTSCPWFQQIPIFSNHVPLLLLCHRFLSSQ